MLEEPLKFLVMFLVVFLVVLEPVSLILVR